MNALMSKQERVELLKARIRELWMAGMTCTQIGDRLGVTKNVVVGHSRRMNLPARPSPISRSSVPKMPRRTEGSMPMKAVLKTVTEHHAPIVRSESGPDGCRWPEGDPKSENFRFCQAPRPLGRSYCDAHHARAFERRG